MLQIRDAVVITDRKVFSENKFHAADSITASKDDSIQLLEICNAASKLDFSREFLKKKTVATTREALIFIHSHVIGGLYIHVLIILTGHDST